MNRLKLPVAVFLVAALLTACGLVPPIPIGPNALGYDGEDILVPLTPTAADTAVPLDASGFGTMSHTFPNVDSPDLPVGPSLFEAVQGFEPEVTVSGDLPETLEVSGTLEFTLIDNAADGPDPVEEEIEFGPLTLERDPGCDTSGASCTYTFEDVDAAAESLTFSVSGGELGRIIDILFNHGTNTVELVLTVTTDGEPTSISFTIDVVENYIRF